MAPSTSVPSKAVLNTLRGLLFTTSCSVLILTEERRRRIKIARSIVDNAKKLHTLKRNHGTVALAGGLSSWDMNVTDWNNDAARIPRPPGERRLRRAVRSNEPLKDYDPDMQVQHPAGQLLEPAKSPTSTKTTHNPEPPAREAKAQPLGIEERPSLFAAPEHRAFTQIPPVKDISSELASIRLDTGSGTEATATSDLEWEAQPNSDVRATGQSDPVASEIYAKDEDFSRFSVAEALTTRRHSVQSVVTGKTRPVDRTDSKPIRLDFKDKRKLIRRDAAAGRWDSAERGLRSLASDVSRHYVVREHQTFQILLHKLVDVFIQDNPVREIDKLIRKWESRYGMRVKEVWAQLVMDQYSKLDAHARQMSWMQYCGSRGVHLKEDWLQRSKLEDFTFKDSLDKDEGVSARKIPLRNHDGASAPSTPLQSDDSASSQATSLHSDDDASTEASSLQSDGYALHGAKDDANESSWPAVDMIQRANTLASREEWGSVCEVFAHVFPVDYGASEQCLELAMIAHLKKSDNGVQQATNILQEAQLGGHDVSGPMRLLMLAQLKAGCDVFHLVHQTLDMGVRVHDSVYNMAAQTLASAGDRRASIKMCELAARENGNRQLAYNAFNFANLVTAYTGLEQYKALTRLLSDFTSVTEKWYLAKPCKESIKFATKLVAAKSVAAAKRGKRHKQILERLGEAYTHIKIGRRMEKSRAIHPRADLQSREVSPRMSADLQETTPYNDRSGIRRTNIEEQTGVRSAEDTRGWSDLRHDRQVESMAG